MSKEEARKRAESIKKLLKDYQELAPQIGIDTESQERTIDMFLDDLQKVLNETNEQ
ncbi:MAG: hypothetical protein LBE56_07200 [Tannerella sp.]|jgi:hypothetical protein|nr:hypothetical protein [Tannerella sp.]